MTYKERPRPRVLPDRTDTAGHLWAHCEECAQVRPVTLVAGLPRILPHLSPTAGPIRRTSSLEERLRARAARLVWHCQAGGRLGLVDVPAALVVDRCGLCPVAGYARQHGGAA